MRPLFEIAAQAGGESNGGFPEPVAQAVGGGQGLLPALVAVFAKQVHLLFAFAPAGGVNSQQAHGGAGLPVGAEQLADFVAELGIQLGGAGHGMRARDE